MIIKRPIAAAALLTFTAISGLAYAGTQPSNRRSWPRQTRSSTLTIGEEATASVVANDVLLNEDDRLATGHRDRCARQVR